MNEDFERLEQALDDEYHGIRMNFNSDTNITMEFWTDTAGQDVYIDIDFDGTAKSFVENFTEYAENYDPDEEASYYVESLGKRGVPSSMRTLIEDMDEVKETLERMAEIFNEELNEIENEREER